MNYSEVARIAGRKAARRLQSDRYYNNHIAGHEKQVEAGRLDDLTRGAVVLGVEPVNDPLIDGIAIYLQAQGAVFALFVDTEIEEQGSGIAVLRISKADVA